MITLKIAVFALAGLVCLSALSVTGQTFICGSGTNQSIDDGLRAESRREYDKALDAFKDAVRSGPDCALGHIGLGDTLTLVGRYADALIAYQNALKVATSDARPMIFSSMSYTYIAANHLDDALQALNEVIRLERKNAGWYKERARLYLLRNEGASVVADAETASNLKAKGWTDSVFASLAVIGYLGYLQQHQKDAGDKYLTSMVPKAKDKGWPYPVVRFLQKEIDAAALLREAETADRSIQANAYLGAFLIYSGKREEALPYLNFAAGQKPDLAQLPESRLAQILLAEK